MIAKILKPTSSFAGIAYSEKKVEKGLAVFCGAFNFPFLSNDMSISNYVTYLERLSDTSKKAIKNKQFHATISTKGKEYDSEALVGIAHRWMQKMEYGNQPYLIYFHNDTDNNHIHIISSRIDSNGNRINPYMEGRRAGIAIREIMNQDLHKQATTDIQDLLSNYSFSTVAQYCLLLEKRGWKVFKKNGIVNIHKYVNQGTVSLSEVEAKAKTYVQNKPRLSQLRAIITKYSGMPIEMLQKMMHDKFGVDIVFHQAKNYDKPYGYTIIDHPTKTVYKGGEILPLERLVSSITRERHRELAYNIFRDAFLSENRLSYKQLKKLLQQSRYYIKQSDIYLFGDKEPLFSLSIEMYKALRYNDRLEDARRFVLKNEIEMRLLSKLFFVKPEDLQIAINAYRNDDDCRNMVQSFEGNKELLQKYLESQNYMYISFEDSCYIVDFKTCTMYCISGLGFDGDHSLSDYYDRYAIGIENNEALSSAMGVFALLAGVFGHLEHGSDSVAKHRDQEEEKRKRRRRNL